MSVDILGTTSRLFIFIFYFYKIIYLFVHVFNLLKFNRMCSGMVILCSGVVCGRALGFCFAKGFALKLDKLDLDVPLVEFTYFAFF